MAGAVLHIGFDDTDSPEGMCTTFLAYRAASLLREGGAEFLDYPRLVRFNPNIPWKTRGNGAVSMRVRTADPGRVREQVRGLVDEYSDTRNGANPGLAFVEGERVPGELADLARLAMWQLVGRGSARRLAERCGLEHHYVGNGQGLVGAMGAIGYRFGDSTLELLCYRRPEMLGTPRRISGESVRIMQERTFPRTFHSFDTGRNRMMIAPHGPDPVFYGIRGEDAASLLSAARMIRTDEEPDGFMIFRSNQGTGEHLRNRLDPGRLGPYQSGVLSGTVSSAPAVSRGGHVYLTLECGGHHVSCAVYRPTGMTSAASKLAPGDGVTVGGGVRRASRNHPRTLNLEFIRVTRLARIMGHANPRCTRCRKNMKSKGRGQGFECVVCGRRSAAKVAVERPRGLGRRLYLPAASAHRHLSRPAQRAGVRSSPGFGGPGWLVVNRKG